MLGVFDWVSDLRSVARTPKRRSLSTGWSKVYWASKRTAFCVATVARQKSDTPKPQLSDNRGDTILEALESTAGQLVARVLQRQPIGMGNLAGSGAVAMGRMVRTITAGVVLVAVTVTNQSVGVAALAVYAIA